MNAFRHAQARRIDVEISGDVSHVVFRFRDDGQGIAAEVQRLGHRSGHWGLSGMHERARAIGAQLSLWSRPGSGTEVELLMRCPRRRRRLWSSRKAGGES